ncbi:hypothetical protein, partial [Streptomyces sp. NPDC005568]|uniref:hypothetical protein n=1 Tax=Streptomyces sp. NPDC005568 TaxID=3156887 RepID=UPI0033A5A87D
MSRAAKRTPKKPDRAAEAFAAGLRLVRANPALAALDVSICREESCTVAPHDGLVRVDSGRRWPCGSGSWTSRRSTSTRCSTSSTWRSRTRT